MMHRSLSLLATLALIVIFSLPAAAQGQQPWTQVGSLECKVDPNVGFIFVGHQPMQCTYTPSLAPAPPQYYDGAINTVGIDIGVSAGSVLAWGVFAPTTGLPQGALCRRICRRIGRCRFCRRRRRQRAYGRIRAHRRPATAVAARLARVQRRAGSVVTQIAPGDVEMIRCVSSLSRPLWQPFCGSLFGRRNRKQSRI